MKAFIVEKAGGLEVLRLKDIDQPKPGGDDVLVEVKAISINPVDFKVRAVEEVMTMICGEERPLILGWDVAGKVAAVGDNVKDFQKGDAVFGMVNFPGVGKGYAEYVVSPSNHLAKVPEGTSMEQAAATTLAALTALQAMQDTVKKGDRVLIHAGSGGVGHFAIQMAKNMGAHVTATSSAKNRDFIMSLGADEHIDYRSQVFQDVVSDIDFVLDGMGGEVLSNSVKVVKDGATIVSLPSPEFPADVTMEAEKRNLNVSFMLVASNGADMNTLKGLLESGIVKPHVSKIFPFIDLGQAHAALETGRTVGKVVVTI